MADQRLVPDPEAAHRDLDVSARGEHQRAMLWEGLHAIASHYGVDLVLTRSKARWDERYDPPKLLEVTVRLRRPGYKRPKRVRRVVGE